MFLTKENTLKKKYVSFSIKINEEFFEMAVAMVSDLQFEGIVESYDQLTFTFDEHHWSDDLKAQILDILSIFEVSEINTVFLDDKNWNEEWEQNLQPIIVNERIAITPSWKKNEVNQELTLVIDPKMSFGTGHHATTRLVCRLMENEVKKDSFWIDAGTGTGVLAILAAKLGAKKCYAFDNFDWAVENSIENAIQNNVNEIITIEQADIDNIVLEECDGIAANLFLNLVLNSFDLFHKSLEKSQGPLLISGILIYDKDQVIEKGLASGFDLIETITEEEWIAFHFKAKSK